MDNARLLIETPSLGPAYRHHSSLASINSSPCVPTPDLTDARKGYALAEAAFGQLGSTMGETFFTAPLTRLPTAYGPEYRSKTPLKYGRTRPQRILKASALFLSI